jgi:hypothetical protein
MTDYLVQLHDALAELQLTRIELTQDGASADTLASVDRLTALTLDAIERECTRRAAIAELERPGGCGAARLAVYWTARSSNSKTGPIPVSTTSAETCPAACPLKGGRGCYAENGNLGLLWRGLSSHRPGSSWPHGRGMARGTDWRGLCRAVGELPDGTLWRHNQAGDLPHTGEMISDSLVEKLVNANRGKRGFTYTHHDVERSEHNRNVVAWANRNGFTVNLSANNVAHADRLADLGVGPVVAVLPIDGASGFTPAGRRVVVCPATVRDDVTCASCGLCQVVDRKVIVGFPAHGARARAAARFA